MRVRELMTADVRTCSPSDKVFELAKTMQSTDVGAIPVVEGQTVVGIVTDRDIVVDCIARGLDPKTTAASSCMTKDPVSVSPDTDAHEAAQIMSEHRVRRLPVVENGRLAGILALADLATVNIHADEAGEALQDISEPGQVH